MNETPPKEDIDSIPIAGGEIPMESDLPVKQDEPEEQPEEQPAEPAPPLPARKRRQIEKKSPFGWLRWLLIGIGLVAALYLLSGYFLLPYLITTVLPDELSEALHRPVTIAGASFNPLTLELRLHNGIIGADLDNAGDQVDPVMSFSSVTMDFEAAGLLRKSIICKRVEADQLFLHIVRTRDSTYNILQMLKTLQEDAAADEGPVGGFLGQAPLLFSLNNITLTNSSLVFDDKPAGKTHTVEGIELALPALSNFTYQTGQYITPKFSAKINGSPITMSGSTKVEGDMLEARFQLNLKDLDLPHYFAYLPGRFDFSVTKGRADLDLELVFASGQAAADTQLQLKGQGQLTDIWLTDAGGNTSQAPKIHFSGAFSPLLNQYHFQELRIEKPDIHIDKSPKGHWSFPGISRSAAAPATAADSRDVAGRPLALQIDRLLLIDGKISLVDRAVKGGFAASWSEVNVSMDSFITPGNKPAPFALNGMDQGKTRISSQGNIIPAPFQAEGLLVADRLDLARFAPYIGQGEAVKIQSGFADKLEARYLIKAGGKKKPSAWEYAFHDAKFTINNLTLARKNRDWLRLPRLTVKQASLDSARRTINLGELDGGKGYIFLHWNKEGNLNWQAPGQGGKNQAGPWRTTVNAVTFKGSTIEMVNDSFTGPLTVSLDNVDLSATPAKGREQPGAVSVSAVINKKGRLTAKGSLALDPFAAELDCSVAALPLASISPLINRWFTLEVADGTCRAKGRVKLPEIAFTGEAEVSSFAAVNQQQKKLVAVKQAVASNIEYSQERVLLSIDTLSLDSPYLHWVIYAKGGSNLRTFFTNPWPGAQKELHFNLSTIELNGGELAFTDLTVSPRFDADIVNISGAVTGLLNTPGSRAALALHGTTRDASPLAVTGSFGFFDQRLFSDCRSQADSLDITRFAPYFEPYLGYRVKAGRVSLTSTCNLAGGSIAAQNDVRIEGFSLGNRINYDSSLPLTVALLTDSSGIMTLDIPIQGDADDPSFSLRGGFTRFVRNLLLKTTVSPFALLAATLPQEPVPDHLLFAYGERNLSDEGRQHLAELAALLNKRPLLTVTINGSADIIEDREALKARKQQEAEQERLAREAQLSLQLSKTYGREEIITPGQIPPAGPQAGAGTAPREIVIKDAALLLLAEERVESVRAYLTETLGIDAQRVNTGTLKLASSAEPPTRNESRVDFILGTLVE